MRLIDEMLAGEALHQAFFLESEMERARIAMLGVRGVEDKFRNVLKVRNRIRRRELSLTDLFVSQSGLDHLFNQVLRPRLRPLLSDVYKDVSYMLDEDSYAEAEYRDDVRKRFVKAWEALLSGYRVGFLSLARHRPILMRRLVLAAGIVHVDQLQLVLCDGGQRLGPALGGHDPRDEVYRGSSPPLLAFLSLSDFFDEPSSSALSDSTATFARSSRTFRPNPHSRQVRSASPFRGCSRLRRCSPLTVPRRRRRC